MRALCAVSGLLWLVGGCVPQSQESGSRRTDSADVRFVPAGVAELYTFKRETLEKLKQVVRPDGSRVVQAVHSRFAGHAERSDLWNASDWNSLLRALNDRGETFYVLASPISEGDESPQVPQFFYYVRSAPGEFQISAAELADVPGEPLQWKPALPLSCGFFSGTDDQERAIEFCANPDGFRYSLFFPDDGPEGGERDN